MLDPIVKETAPAERSEQGENSRSFWLAFLLRRCAAPYESWKMRRAMGRSSAHTLLELLVVIAILGIISVIALPAFFTYLDKVRVTICIVNMKEIEKNIDLFFEEHGHYPNSLADVGMDTMTDPWGNPFEYLKIQGGGPGTPGKARKNKFMVPINSDYDLYSMGPDGKSVGPLTAKHSRDDIIRASNGNFFGRASEY